MYIYLRVSTDEQKRNGKGLDAQLAECTAICERLGLAIVKVVSDPGLSGKLPYSERPGLLEAMEGCTTGLASGILAYQQDRYARSPSIDETIREHAIKHGYKLYAGTQIITDEENDMSADAMAFIAGIERKMIVKRLRGGRRQRAGVDGHGSAPLPYGYALRMLSASGMQTIVEIIPDETTAPIVSTIFSMRKEGKTYQHIATYLNEQEIPTPYAGKVYKEGKRGTRTGQVIQGKWTRGQVYKIVEREILYTTGQKEWKGIEGDMIWPILYKYDEEE